MRTHLPSSGKAVLSLTLSGREDHVAVAAAFSPYRSILARYMWISRDADKEAVT